jgi:hypothetical protein
MMKEREMNEKIDRLIKVLESDRGHPYALGWLIGMMRTIDLDLGLSKKQMQKLHELLDTNIRWAESYPNMKVD